MTRQNRTVSLAEERFCVSTRVGRLLTAALSLSPLTVRQMSFTSPP